MFRIAIASLFLLLGSLPAFADVKLVMFEEDGCPYCEQFHAEIGPAYPKTAEAQVAPIEYVDLWGGVPSDMQLVSRPNYTPTFVLLDDGVEIGRIEGYPGDDFFWFLLGKLIHKLPQEKRAGFQG